MAFDPDEFLKKETASNFDPDKFLGIEPEKTLGEKAKELVFGDYTPAESVKRQLGLTGRYLTEGTAGVADFLASPVRGGLNMLLPESMQIPTLTQQAENLPLPKPETTTEKMVGEASKALTATGITMGGAGATQPLTSVGQGIKQALTTQPKVQAGSAVGTGIGVGTAKEANMGMGGQLLLGLAGGLGGGGITGAFTKTKPTLTPKQQAAEDAQKLGYAVLPEDAGAGPLAKLIQSFSGKFKGEELISSNNQQITNKIAAKYLDLPENTPLTAETIKNARSTAFQAYDDIKNTGTINLGDKNPFSPLTKQVQVNKGGTDAYLGKIKDNYFMTADDAISQLRTLRQQTSDYYRSAINNPKFKVLAKKYEMEANKLEKIIENHVKQQNNPELYNNFRNAREYIAKTFTIEKAANPVTGNVDAKNIASQFYNKNVPITGEMKKVAEFSKAFPNVTKAVDKAPSAVTLPDLYLGALGIGPDLMIGSPLLTAMPAARIAARYGIASGIGQKLLTKPSTPGTQTFPYQSLLTAEEEVPTIDVGSQQFPIAPR
jgi:hypothetical protein